MQDFVHHVDVAGVGRQGLWLMFSILYLQVHKYPSQATHVHNLT